MPAGLKLDRGVTFDHLPTVYEEYTGKIAIENLRPSWLIFSGGFKKTRLLLAAKRMLDVFAAFVGLVLLSPVMIVVALAVRLTSKGPALSIANASMTTSVFGVALGASRRNRG